MLPRRITSPAAQLLQSRCPVQFLSSRSAPMATPIDTEIQRLTDQIEVLKRQLSGARRRRSGEAVADYALLDPDGSPTTLSALFGDGDDLIVIHNMGRGCVYCTLWADGFSSLV